MVRKEKSIKYLGGGRRKVEEMGRGRGEGEKEEREIKEKKAG